MALLARRQLRFLDLLHGVAFRLGMDPAEDLTNQDARALAEYLTESYRFCYEFFPWPETLQRAQLTVASNQVEWEDGGGDHLTLGQVTRVTQRDPWVDTNPNDYEWRYSNAGIILPRVESGTVYVEWQPRCWPLTVTNYDSTVVYAAGDTVYYLGRVYAYTGTVDANTPDASTEWDELPIPYYLRDAIIAGAHATKLMEEGQHASAMLPDQIMEGMLEREMAKLHTFSGKTERFDVTPYAVRT